MQFVLSTACYSEDKLMLDWATALGVPPLQNDAQLQMSWADILAGKAQVRHLLFTKVLLQC